MGKSKKKKKVGDFQKAKLKVGRIVPKGRNVTNTSFSTTKVNIPEQFHNRDVESEVCHELSLEELLSRVEHHNARISFHSLEKIGEKIESDHPVMLLKLSEILGKVLKSITSSFPNVRKEGIKVLRHIFSRTDASKIESFSHLIISHLCCALTHNSIEIRTDSLILLDHVLKWQPSNICHSEMLLNNFLEQISARTIHGRSITDYKCKRMLHVNPDEKIPSHVFRIEVLGRALKFIKAIVASLTKEDINEDELNEVIWEDKTKPLYVTIYARGGLKPLMPSEPNYMSKSSNDCRHNVVVMKIFISELMPLLFESWRENIFVQQSSESASSTSTKANESLSTVVELISAIGDWIQLVDNYSYKKEMVNWFKINYNTSFCKIFMEHFPYEEQLHCFQSADVRLNFAICTLYSAFVLGTENATEKNLNAVQNYTIKSLPSQIPKNTSLIPDVIKIIRHFLTYDSQCVTTHCQLACLQSIIHALHPTDKYRSMVHKVFSDIALDWKYRDLLESSGLSDWLANLINEIFIMVESGVIDKQLLTVIKKVSARQYSAFMEQMQNQTKDIFILLTSDEEAIQDIAAHLITNMGEISSEFFIELTDVIRNPLVSMKSVCRILRLLSTRMLRENNPNMEFSDLLRFYFALIAGTRISNMDQWLNHDLESFSKTLEEIHPLKPSFTILPSKLWMRHSQIVDVVIECLLRFPDHENISQCTYYFLSQFLNACGAMPIHCALGLLTLKQKIGCYQGYQCQEDDLLQLILELTLCCFTYGTVVQSLVEDEERFNEYGLSALHGLISDKNAGFEIVTLINNKFQVLDDLTPTLAFYTIRMISILLRNPYIKPFSIGAFHITLRVIKKKVGNQLDGHRWWINIYNSYCKQSRYISSKQRAM